MEHSSYSLSLLPNIENQFFRVSADRTVHPVDLCELRERAVCAGTAVDACESHGIPVRGLGKK